MNSDRSSAILAVSEASFASYNEELELHATQEEAAAYQANMVLEAEQELEFQRCFKGEEHIRTW